MVKNLSAKRFEELRSLWWEESADPDTQEWRYELTAEETQLVAFWDKSYNLGVKSLCQQILKHECECATKMHTPELHV